MYTEEQTKMLQEYPKVSVAELAEKLGKNERSIVAKLSRMGVYQKKVYVSKTGEAPISKLEIVAEVEKLLNEKLEGLEKSPKTTLLKLRGALSKS